MGRMILRIIKNSWLLIGATICFSLFMCGIGSLNAYYSEGDRTFASSHWSKLVNPDSKYIIELAKGKTIDEIVEFVYTKRRTVPTDDNLPAECFAKQIMEGGYYEGDCLSSALLVVSMARSIGIPPDKIRVILFARHASPQI
ncbi:MAG: hypothetical protein QXR87_03940, partial [Candidatus Hadarchaeales archaeon]